AAPGAGPGGVERDRAVPDDGRAPALEADAAAAAVGRVARDGAVLERRGGAIELQAAAGAGHGVARARAVPDGQRRLEHADASPNRGGVARDRAGPDDQIPPRSRAFEDAAPVRLGRVARDRAVLNRDGAEALRTHSTPPGGGLITRDRAVAEDQ